MQLIECVRVCVCVRSQGNTSCSSFCVCACGCLAQAFWHLCRVKTIRDMLGCCAKKAQGETSSLQQGLWCDCGVR